jgi:hypothetical protein
MLRKVIAKVILLILIVANLFFLPYGYISLQGHGDACFVMYEFVTERVIGNPEIVFTGDSITHDGYIWASKISQSYFRTSNIARRGLKIDDIKCITLKAIDKKPKYIFIMGGRNDMPTNYNYGNAQSTIASYKQILDTAVRYDIKVCVTSTLYSSKEPNAGIVDELNTFLKEYCANNGQIYIDLNSKLSANCELRREFTTDGIHINASAYDIWAGMIKSVLE